MPTITEKDLYPPDSDGEEVEGPGVRREAGGSAKRASGGCVKGSNSKIASNNDEDGNYNTEGNDVDEVESRASVAAAGGSGGSGVMGVGGTQGGCGALPGAKSRKVGDDNRDNSLGSAHDTKSIGVPRKDGLSGNGKAIEDHGNESRAGSNSSSSSCTLGVTNAATSKAGCSPTGKPRGEKNSSPVRSTGKGGAGAVVDRMPTGGPPRAASGGSGQARSSGASRAGSMKGGTEDAGTVPATTGSVSPAECSGRRPVGQRPPRSPMGGGVAGSALEAKRRKRKAQGGDGGISSPPRADAGQANAASEKLVIRLSGLGSKEKPGPGMAATAAAASALASVPTLASMLEAAGRTPSPTREETVTGSGTEGASDGYGVGAGVRPSGDASPVACMSPGSPSTIQDSPAPEASASPTTAAGMAATGIEMGVAASPGVSSSSISSGDVEVCWIRERGWICWNA